MASSNTNNVNQKEPQHQKQLLSKIAISNRHGEDSPYFDGWSAYRSNPYHPTRNPNGVLQMGLAENPLCLDLIQEWIQDNPHASICSAEGQGDFKDMAIFQDYHGLPEFRQAVAKFMTRVRGGPKNKVNFDPNRIVMSGGATGASETLIFCLADPGDAFLIPSPYYPAFDRDLRWRTGLELIPVPCNSSNGFKITTEALDQAYHQAINSNHKVKGMILANPSNPLGTILDRESLTSLVSFANNKQIHLVVDEIYSATVFRSPDIVSLAEIVAEEKSNDHLNLDLFHITYSLSKDMGLPGFRVGIIYSYNDEVVNCARRMSSFGLVSSQTQHLLASMLSDEVFVDRFLAESRCRLATRHRKFTKGVGEVGISCLDSNAGLFVWMDLRHLLKSQSDDGELELWRTIINEVKINVSPGMSFHCSEAGWFRVCYANMDEDTLDVALTRIRSFVHKGKEQVNTHNKRSRTWQKNLRLSFGKSSSSMNGNGNGGASMRCDEDILSSPHLMSPHSPMPCSPLVKART